MSGFDSGFDTGFGASPVLGGDNVNNWYVGRETVKRAMPINGSDRDAVLDRYIEAASREFDMLTGRRFLPKTQTRSYTWPQRDVMGNYILRLDEDLISVSALTDEGDDTAAIAAADYYLEPVNTGPPYDRIEIDKSSTESFKWKNTTQRAVRVTGSWGYGNNTVTGGTVASGLASDATATTFVCSDGSLIDVGDTLLIETEQVFVSGRTIVDTTANLNDASVTASIQNTSITVSDGAQINTGEIIQIDSERMRVISIATNVLTVERAYDGTTLAAHSNATDVYALRTLTIARGANGTTAATHANSTAISIYRPPADVRTAVLAKAISDYVQGEGGWTGVLGGGESSMEGRRSALIRQWESAIRRYTRHSLEGI